MLENGCALRFLIIDPDSDAVSLLAKSVVYEIKDKEAYTRSVRDSIAALQQLQKRFDKLLQIRVHDSVPPFGLLIKDPSSQKGVIRLELYTYAVPIRNRPTLTITNARDPKSFSFFYNQFQKVWNESPVAKVIE